MSASALAGRAAAIRRLNANPTASVSGANTSACPVSSKDRFGLGQSSSGRSCVMSEPIATARLEVISAAPSARGCQLFKMMRTVNNAPASGTA